MFAATAIWIAAGVLQLGEPSAPDSTIVPSIPADPSGAKFQMVSPDELMAFAADAQQHGDIRTAEAAYRALANDPNAEVRAEAMFRHGKLLVQTGHPNDGAVLLRQVVDARPDAVPARMELAKTLDQIGDKDGAWRQVRAVQSLGLPIDVARMVDRYSEALRAARPMGASFEVAIAPDTNINRSTRSDTLGTVLGDFEIDGDSKATSGTGLALDGQFYRRVALGNGNHHLLARVSAAADLYKKSSFNDIALDFAAGPELQFGRNRLNIEAAATQRWYGMDPYMRSARLSASLIRPLGRKMQVQLVGSVGLADYKVNDLQDGKTFLARAKFERALSATTGVAINLSAFRNSASDPGYSTTEWRAGLIGWRDIGRATFTAEAEYGTLRADERLILFPDKRSDRYFSFSLGATFRQFNFAGFAPLTRVTFERNQSTIEFYDYRRTRTEFGIARAF